MKIEYKAKFVAIDIETSGLWPGRDSKIYCCSINDGITITVETKMEKLRALLENPKITKVIHNAAFDSFWLRQLHNIKVVNIWDTRLMEQILLGENLGRNANVTEEQRKQSSSSLLYTLSRYGLAELKNKEMRAAFATRDKNAFLTEKEINYVMNDVKYLLLLQAMQERRLIKLDLMKVANLENKVVEVVVDMRARGIGFDEKVWLTVARQNETAFYNLVKRMPASVSNWNSPIQVKKYFNGIGIPLQSLTTIDDIAFKYPDKLLLQFIEMRKHFKNATTYGRSWLQDEVKGNTVDDDKRVRAEFEQILNTGRFSCSHPNLQQLPKDGLQRSAFVPSKGNVFIIGDFSGQEIGIMAAASKEELWIKAMLRREDIHSLTASLLYPNEWKKGELKGCTFPKKCSCPEHRKIREIAKTINFAIAYGAGPLNIGMRLRLEPKIAGDLLTKYKRVVPSLNRWLNKNSKNSSETRLSYSADPFKRRRVLRDFKDALYTIGKNNPVQSCGANMIKLAMVSMDLPIVLIIHDEIIVEVPKDQAKKAAAQLKNVMEKAAEYCTGIPGLIEVTPRIANSLAHE